MNQFEALCRLASDENWCWQLSCTTCGHMHFRYSFAELAAGKSPEDRDWLIHWGKGGYSNNVGPLPMGYTKDQKKIILNICSESSIESIASSCNFPDWLGYLGLVLNDVNSISEAYQLLSSRWASQLINLVSQCSPVYARLNEISNGNGILNIKDLEACERYIIANMYIGA